MTVLTQPQVSLEALPSVIPPSHTMASVRAFAVVAVATKKSVTTGAELGAVQGTGTEIWQRDSSSCCVVLVRVMRPVALSQKLLLLKHFARDCAARIRGDITQNASFKTTAY